MNKHIALAGKGGTGKTTLCALLVRYLVGRYPGKSILAVDADANANLNETLGLEVAETIGTILEDTKKPGAVPTGMTKDLFVEYRLSRALVETEAFDLLVMGNPQGPGCYCYPNDLLKRYLERLSKGYDFVVVDNEAGLEHLSRKIIPRVDILLVTSDASYRGIRSAGRIRQIVSDVGIQVGEMGLVVTRVGEEGIEPLKGEIEAATLPLRGVIPYDPLIVEYDLQGRPLLELPEDSEAVKAAARCFQQLF
ncbi:MAG: AAA family ATPase [Dethiobacteria bacterium]|jgi:CO dehydrogenase maturation factor|nr:AAA family ATPase [Bacillota bacterium]HOP68186.1 AAA family ATPase [Bacillota bacterium]HPT33056.1 AAA family ATPase [Bacillota bacterium]HPZ64851.1 AAA family ATPase [Bacillota bacterium]HQD05240.1 AAA family ATPase [Bacillota bacterium]